MRHAAYVLIESNADAESCRQARTTASGRFRVVVASNTRSKNREIESP
jgi:hypothetical protein